MERWLPVFVLTLFFSMTSYADPNQVDHVVFETTPIKVELPVGKERVIIFPHNEIGFNFDKMVLTDKKFTHLIANGKLYLKAKRSFKTHRTMVQLMTAKGTKIILDLRAHKYASDNTIEVLIEDEVLSASNVGADTVEKTIDEISLYQFAVQQLFSPERVLTSPQSVMRVPMRTLEIIDIYESVTAMPLISWKSGSKYVTAVLFRNNLDEVNHLDWNNIRGRWDKAFFFPLKSLSPAGHAKDSTTAFIVTRRPFADSIE